VRSIYSNYGGAGGVLLVAIGLRFLLDPVLHDTLPLITLVGAVAASGWIGGWRASACAAVLGYLAGQFFFMSPRGHLGLAPGNEVMTLVQYLLSCISIVAISRAWESRCHAVRHQIDNLVVDWTRESERMRVELARQTQAAAAASVAKNEFLANIRHEVRTPLNSIIGLTDLLLESPLSEEQRTQLGFANVAARELFELMDDIIEYAGSDSGRIDPPPEEFSVNGVLEAVCADVAIVAARKDLDLTMVDETNGLRAFGHPARLREALTHLASNAVKFTAQGRVRLRVMCVPHDRQDLELRFVVEDTGIGIAPDWLDRLFSPFQPLDSSITRRYGGVGLGLANTRRLANLMGGDVGVHSTQGEGSTFWFTARVQPVVDPPAGDRIGCSIRVVRDESHAGVRRVPAKLR
jgi:signal transduction histidine kinase